MNLSLIPPINDTLHILLSNSTSIYMMWDYPAEGGGVMEWETQGSDYGRTNVYHPHQVPNTTVRDQGFIPIPNSEKIHIYPNPTNGEVRIELPITLDKRNLKVTIFDSLGREVYRFASQEIGDNNKLHWKPETIASGIYFVEVKSAKQSPLLQRFVMMK